MNESRRHVIKIIDLIFPRRCPVCDDVVKDRGELICKNCRPELSRVKSPLCFKCGKEIESEIEEFCYDCTFNPKSFEKNVAVFNYNEAARQSVVRFKYKGRQEYAKFYAREIFNAHRDFFTQIKPRLIIPVPVHKTRLKERGYNQAQLIAEELGKIFSHEFGYEVFVRSDILLRTKKTEVQKNLDASRRAVNIFKAMSVTCDLSKVGSILLVDDIYTTGSTISACTKALKSAGARKVYAATVCIGKDE